MHQFCYIKVGYKGVYITQTCEEEGYLMKIDEASLTSNMVLIMT